MGNTITIEGDNKDAIVIGNHNNVITQKAPHTVPKNLASTLTPTLAHFVGRESELEEIEQRLKEDSMLLLLNGIGGIGKSTLASYYFHHHKERFDHYGYVQVDEAIELNFQKAFRTSLDLKNETLEESFEEAISKLSNLSGKKLLVIDDLKVASDSPSLRAILGLAHCGFTLLFTSRTTFPHLPHRFIEHLPLPQAKELFGKHYRKAVDEEKLEQLLRIIDSHTLLIELIAKIMVEEGYALEKILTQLSQGEMVTIEYTDDEGRLAMINDRLNRLFNLQNLSETYLLLLKKFVILPSADLPFGELSEILGETAQGRLTFLVKRGWLIGGEESYKLHPILHAYLLANTPPTREEISPQFDFFMNAIRNSSASDELSKKNHDFPYFEAMARFWVKNGSMEDDIGYFLGQLGLLYDSIGAYSHALEYHERSLAISQAIGDKSGEGTTLNNIGQIYKARGDYTTALTYLQQSLAIRQAIGDKSGEGTTLNNIALIYDARGDLTTALTYLQQSLAIRQAIGDKSGMCATLFNIGHIHWANDDHDHAIQNWVEVYRIAKQIENAQALHALEGLAKQLGHEEGLGLWETLSQMRP
ncbi:MAG: tetratricopeptide repeat protein [Sulfuricurvum sp.]